jgi:hypothetical protein
MLPTVVGVTNKASPTVVVVAPETADQTYV